jgi:hypothetical protein
VCAYNSLEAHLHALGKRGVSRLTHLSGPLEQLFKEIPGACAPRLQQ